MKVLCVLLPHFLLRCELQRHPEINRAVVLTHTMGSQKLVLDASPELEGLQRDMPLQQAIARYGDAELIPADVPYYHSIFNDLLDQLGEKCPLVEGLEPGQVYLNVDGMHLIYPNYKSLINAVREVIPDTYAPQIGIAEGKFLAYLAAIHNSPGRYQILTDDIDSFLRNISCDKMPISIQSKSKLHNFGLHTLGQIAVLPVGPIQAQFGMEGKRIWELARGYDDTPLYPRFTKEVIEENTTLISVTASLETILVTLESLLARAFIRITPQGMGIRSLALWTRGWNGEHWERAIRFKEPAMDVRSSLSRIKQFLENYPQSGPVEQLGIKVTGLGHGVRRQRSIFAEVRAQDHLLDDIEQLELRLESPQVFRIKEVEPWSRIPERQYALKPLSR
jgi:DNA polymerase-4/protein ImuB